MNDDELSCAMTKGNHVALSRSLIDNKFSREIKRHCNAEDRPWVLSSVRAGVIFGQEEAGSGVIVSADGTVLTCADCLGDEPAVGIHKAVILYDGRVCTAVSIKVDVKRDTALLQLQNFLHVDGSWTPVEASDSFPFVSLAAEEPVVDSHLLCVGQPASEDLESKTARKTGYPVIDISFGSYVGLKKGDVHNNHSIGKLKHNCWTYWGHSGAPLLNYRGELCGLHSSWDDKTTMRHGIHWQALRSFLVTDISSSCSKKRARPGEDHSQLVDLTLG